MSLSCLCLVLSLSLLKFRLNLNLNQVFMGADYCSTFALQTSSDCGRAVGDTGPILPGPGSLRRGAGGHRAVSLPAIYSIRQRPKSPLLPLKKSPKADGWEIAFDCVRACERACVRACELACVRSPEHASVRLRVRLSVRAYLHVCLCARAFLCVRARMRA